MITRFERFITMSHITQYKLHKVLGALYESAHDGSAGAWHSSFTQIADLFSCGPGTLNLYSRDNYQCSRITSTASDDCLKAFDTRFKHISPIQKRVLQTPVGKTYWRLRDCPDRDFLNSEFYRDFAVKENIYDIVYIKLCQRSGKDAGMTFTRPKTKPFTSDELKAIGSLIPHFQRAVQIFLDIADLRAQNFQTKETIGMSQRGVFFLNSSGKVIYYNTAAEHLVAMKDGVEIKSDGTLFASKPRDMQNLKMMVDGVFHRDGNGVAFPGGFMNISRPSGRPAFQVHISPFSQQNFSGYYPETTALLFVCDPEYRSEALESPLRQMYGLTHTEACVAGILVKGKSLKEAGEILNIKQSTVRTHMKHIFSKMGCKRQGEMIAIIFNGLAALSNLDRLS